MVKSLYTGVSGMKTHQQKMDVIGNNIANVNTTGYKTNVVTFADVYYQTKKSPSGASTTKGGINPIQVGYGVKLNSTTPNMTQSGFTFSDSIYDMAIDGEGFFQVMDAKLYTYGVNQPIAAIESLSATTLRNIIGEMELDHTLTSRDTINSKITAILDEATDKWGIKVNRVEVKNIIPPREIQEAMEKQMKAEREKRAVILKADGEKQAAITAAEGEKESAILRADAVKQQRILEAEGEAQAILAVQKANADAIRLLNEAMPTDKVLALRSLEALAKVANGKATKIIIPSDLQNLGGVVPSIKELMTDPKDAE